MRTELARIPSPSETVRRGPLIPRDDPTSASPYLSLTGDPQIAGIFSFRDEAILGNPLISALRLPAFAVLGSRDEFIASDADQCLDLLRRSLKTASSFTSRVLVGANHVYDGFEAELGAVLAGWATSV